MSLDVTLEKEILTDVYSANITHNLGDMAQAAGIYEHLWHPESLDIMYARELIEPLEHGLFKMKKNPDKYRRFDSPNGWGVYDDFVPWIEGYIKACKEHPDAVVSVSR